MEKAGVPTVTLVTEPFLTLAENTVVSQGLIDLCFVKVPHPIGMIAKEDVYAKADAAIDDIIKAATTWKPSEAKKIEQKPPYPARTFKFTGTYADVNKLFAKRSWSLSLPIVPPTPERVAEMLKGTKRDPSEVVWVVPPRQGMLTVELVAALGVMAGAKPEQMPLLLAAVEAMKDPNASWRGTSTTTAPTVPVFVISGPIIEKLKLNPGTGTAGPENPVTNALGYFVNLVGDVVGGSIPPNFDKSTHGTSADFVATIFCENDKGNPWGISFAEQQGFKKTDSVITYTGCYLGTCNVDHDNSTGKGLLNTFAVSVLGAPSGVARCLTDWNKIGVTGQEMNYVLVMVCPEHAATIAKDFPNMRDAQEYLIKAAAMPYKYWSPAKCKPTFEYNEDTVIPRFVSPESIKIVVTGGAGKQSQFWSPFPQVLRPVSKLIAE